MLVPPGEIASASGAVSVVQSVWLYQISLVHCASLSEDDDVQLKDAAELRCARTAPQLRAHAARNRTGTPFARAASNTWCLEPDLEH